MHCARTFSLSETYSLRDYIWYLFLFSNRSRKFSYWSHHSHNINNLEFSLLILFYRFLSRNDQKRKTAQLRISHSCKQICGPRAKCRERNPHFACNPAKGSCHKSCRLLVTSGDESDFGFPHCIQKSQILLSWYAKNILHAMGFQTFHKYLCCVFSF